MTLEASILAEIKKDESCSFGVAVKHLESKETVHVHGDQLFQQASVFKIPILFSLLKLHEKENNILHERYQLRTEDIVAGSGILKDLQPGAELSMHDLATLMIIVSDNTATDQVFQRVGLPQLQRDLENWGLKNTTIHHTTYELLAYCAGFTPEPYSQAFYEKVRARLLSPDFEADPIVFQEDRPNNLTTALDMNDLLEKLIKGEIFAEKETTIALDILGRQQLRNRIPYLLPDGTKVAHKTGSLGALMNDAGVIYLPDNKGTLILSIFSSGHKVKSEGEHTIAQIAKLCFDYFTSK